jgi:hypothetical protein
MLGHFQHESTLHPLHLQSVKDRRDLSLELDIDDGSDHLNRGSGTCEICPFLEERGLAASEKAALKVGLRQDLSTLAASMQ